MYSKEDAYDDGHQAGRTRDQKENPFDEHKDRTRHLLWLAGWTAGYQIYKEQREKK
jgi:ribosome modulation factor